MSHPSNDKLYVLVQEEIYYWAGEGVGKLLEKVMDTTPNDVEKLWDLLAQSRVAKEFHEEPSK